MNRNRVPASASGQRKFISERLDDYWHLVGTEGEPDFEGNWGNQKQQATLYFSESITGGTFSLIFAREHETQTLDYDVSHEDLQIAIEPVVGAGNVVVTEGGQESGTEYYIEFPNSDDTIEITINDDDLDGADGQQLNYDAREAAFVKFTKVGKLVFIRGYARTTDDEPDTAPLFILPEGYRPLGKVRFERSGDPENAAVWPDGRVVRDVEDEGSAMRFHPGFSFPVD